MGARTGFGEGRETDEAPAPRGALREYAETILVCVIFVVFARAFVFQQSEIPSGSMEDTILIGDYVLVNRFLYAPTSFAWERRLLPIRSVKRGDIVVFMHPDQPEQDFIKRVIGLPGETVELREGRVHVDGRPLDEPYLDRLYDKGDFFGPLHVDAGHYFLLGDHRNRSADSRVWGLVPTRLLKGRAFLVLFSTTEPASAGAEPGRVTAISLVRKLYNLVFESRWDRFLRPIR